MLIYFLILVSKFEIQNFNLKIEQLFKKILKVFLNL